MTFKNLKELNTTESRSCALVFNFNNKELIKIKSVFRLSGISDIIILKNDNLISNITIFLQSYGILIVIIVLSVIIASAMILVKKPKEILSKIS